MEKVSKETTRESIKYKLHIKTKPHCNVAKPFKDFMGNIMWRCRHETETPKTVIGTEKIK